MLRREQPVIAKTAPWDAVPNLSLDRRTKAVVQWFARMGDDYAARFLVSSRIDLERLKHDAAYGLKAFLGYWAYERQGAARGFRIAAVKAVTLAVSRRSLRRIPAAYGEVFLGKKNARANPALGLAVCKLNIPAVVALVSAGNLWGAFRALALPGVRHKIRAFFIRDVATLTAAEAHFPKTYTAHVLCQPVDVWVTMTEQSLRGGPSVTIPRGLHASTFEMDGIPLLRVACRVTALALSAGVSPLKVNQGMWHFAANFVADAGRLRALVGKGDARALAKEVELVAGFQL